MRSTSAAVTRRSLSARTPVVSVSKPIHGSSIQLMIAPSLAGDSSVAEGGHICVPEAVEAGSRQ